MQADAEYQPVYVECLDHNIKFSENSASEKMSTLLLDPAQEPIVC